MMNLISKDKTSYCLIFDMNDCYSCILKGIDDLKALKGSGMNGFGLAVHDSTDEVAGWSKNYGFSPFFVIKKFNFYNHVHTSITPVLVKFDKGVVENYRFILP